MTVEGLASTNYICATCGVQFAASENPPPRCPICEDERQYIPEAGQQWTTMEIIRRDHRNTLRSLEPALLRIETQPEFAIGQGGYIALTSSGNFMWDSNTLVDRETVATLLDRGGLAGIALSHPHFYGAAVDWSQALGGVPIYIHERDQRWMVRPDPSIVFWRGESLALSSDVKLVRCGGHFDGASVLHWRGGAERRGALFTADTIAVGADRASVSFMYSYVNRIPLSAESVRHIVEAVGSLTFDRIYGVANVVRSDAQKALARSAERYIGMIEGTYLPSKTL